MLKDSLNISEEEEIPKENNVNISISNNTSQGKKTLFYFLY